MTYTIIGRDPENGEIGIAIATYSLAVGGTCPHISAGVGVCTSQASTNPVIGQAVISNLTSGELVEVALKRAVDDDEHPRNRQVAVMTQSGAFAVHSGSNTRSFSGHLIGENCLAVGNFLQGQHVLQSMVAEFENTATNNLADRLIGALQAGKDAGGQSGDGGVHLIERSACLMTTKPDYAFPLDVRVDVSDDAVGELARIAASYAEMHSYYLQRAVDPSNLPAQDEYVRQLRGQSS